MSRYEDVPYRGLPVLASAPARLAWTSLVHGGPVPSLDVAHVLELGCGDGANLLPLAAHHPNWTCVGLDLSPGAIARARALASKASLQNAKFDEADVAALELEPTHRFVLAHGLYSWIDGPRREALLRAIAHALAPDGLAYVSFNAQPGWSARGRVRDLLVRARTADLEQARALLGSLRERASDDVWGQLLGHELDRAIQASDDYLVHEYLAEHNDAFWIGDFVRDAERAGLRWIGDSQFDLQEGRGFTAVASELSGDPMQIEERADLLGYRQLRCAVLARADAQGTERGPAALLEDAVLAGVVAATREPFRLEAGVEETLRAANGIEVRVRDPLAKLALLELASIYPNGHRLDDLIRIARAVGARYGLSDLKEEALRGGLPALWRMGALEARLGPGSIKSTPGARPAASAFTRAEAGVRPCVTSALHVAIPLDPIQRAITERLDGTRGAPELASILAREITEGDLAIEGLVGASLERALPETRSMIEQTILLLARWGLVH